MKSTGTPFQRLVWRYLKSIPVGEVRTYKEVACAIGFPDAARAVANACAANTEAITIPCHRVIRSDGELGGYRWGVENKHALLIAEGAWPVDSAPSAPTTRLRKSPTPRP